MMTRTDLLTLAQIHDPLACWVDDTLSDNCLLVEDNGGAIASLLAADPWGGAYEDPWEERFCAPTDPRPKLTRVVFPNMPMKETA